MHVYYTEISLSLVHKNSRRATWKLSLSRLKLEVLVACSVRPFSSSIPVGDLSRSRTTERGTLRLVLHFQCGSGSQTPKDTPPVPGYKHTKWLPCCFQAVQLSARGEKYSWHFACIHHLPCGKTAWVLLGKIAPSLLILAAASTGDWCGSLWSSKWSCAVISVLKYNENPNRLQRH